MVRVPDTLILLLLVAAIVWLSYITVKLLLMRRN